jgi:hypothetical protein
MHTIISKPAVQYGSVTWVLREEDKRRIEIFDMRFLWPLLDISLRSKVRITDTKNN